MTEATADDLRMGFLFKIGTCTNCNACIDACRKYNGTSDDMPARRKITTFNASDGSEVYVATSCMHCEDPACVRVCPSKAIEKLPNGIVALHTERCIGCKYCYEACPFSVPQYSSERMDKCDFCVGNGVEPGTRPRCANACPTGALDGGRLRDLFTRAQSSRDSAKAEGDRVPLEVVTDTAEVQNSAKQIVSSTLPRLYLLDEQAR